MTVSHNDASQRDDRFRGVFAIPPTPFDDSDNVDEASSARTRGAGAGRLYAENRRELDLLLRDLAPLMRAGRRSSARV